MSDLSLPSDTTSESVESPWNVLEQSDNDRLVKSRTATGDEYPSRVAVDSEQGPHTARLSAQLLSQLPDATQNRMETLQLVQEAKSDHDSESDELLSAVPASYDQEKAGHSQVPILSLSDIPTLRSMYRSRHLLQRDQNVAPNDSYNQIISFCYHDLTHLRIEAIVNSTSRAIRVTSGDTLNNAVHRAAGPAMAKSQGKPKPDRAILTSGYNLPSKHVIHALRPRGMHSNQLVTCYNSALSLAIENRIKTIAFPCIGTGGVGIPPRVAARTALEAIRKYLDTHPSHGLERLVLCMNTAIDERAYMDFLPVYFPPTHGDLDEARSSVFQEDRGALSARVLDTRNQIHRVFSELNTGLSLSVPNFPLAILSELSGIDSKLASIRRFLLWSQEVSQSLPDLKLVCSVMLLLCGAITEIIDLAKDHASLGQRSDLSIWGDFIADMQIRHGLDLSELLKACHYFTESLETLIIREGIEVDQMVAVRQILERYKVKQRAGPGGGGAQDHLNEVLYTREFQRETTSRRQDAVKMVQVPSISQLYKLGELEEKPTLAHPSAAFNHTVCFTREDITKLDVDILVNSMDAAYGGVGALNRTVLAKGGDELRNAVKSFGMCEIGDVRYTEGYLLPARHILHVVPPDLLDKDTRDVLRKIYREALRLAASMRATSIAFPSIGTGLLNYPRRDCASLAMEEVKRHLETAEHNNLLEKIIFVVYTSNDEFIYRSLLPVYFPPINLHINRTQPALQRSQTAATSPSNERADAPRRTLFGSMGEAYRSVRFGKLPAISRPIEPTEKHALIAYESHAKDCVICQQVETLYDAGHDLCPEGYSKAQLVLWYMSMHSDHIIWSKPDSDNQTVQLEVPHNLFPHSIGLLATIEKSHRDTARAGPFVTPDRTYGEFTKDQKQEHPKPLDDSDHNAETLMPIRSEVKKTRAEIRIWSKLEKQWSKWFGMECDVQVDTPEIDITDPSTGRSILNLKVTHHTALQRHKTRPEVMLAGIEYPESYQDSCGNLAFQCRSDAECDALLRAVRRTIIDIQKTRSSEDQQSIPVSQADEDDDLQATAERAEKRMRAHVFTREDPQSIWNLVAPLECDIRIDADAIVALEIGTVYCLLKLLLVDITTLRRHKTAPEFTFRVASTISQYQHLNGEYMFRCQSDADCSLMYRMFQRALEGVHSEQASEGQKDKSLLPEFRPEAADEYLKWNQRLNDIRDELATTKRASGGLTDLQFKMERLSQASSSLHSSSRELEAASELYNASRSPLATRVLVCLVADLKLRPGSYIGLDTDSIVSTLRAPRDQVSRALEELMAEDQIHQTVNDNTFVVSHPPKDLPVLFNEQGETLQPATEDLPTVLHEQRDTTQAHSLSPLSALSDLALELFSRFHFEIFDNLAAVQAILAERNMLHALQQANALDELRTKMRWYNTSDTILGPRLEPSHIVSGNRDARNPWTCIQRGMVDPRIFKNDVEIGEAYVVLRRVLEKGELERWILRTRELQQLEASRSTSPTLDLKEQQALEAKPTKPAGSLRTSITAKKVLAWIIKDARPGSQGGGQDWDVAAALEKPIEEVRQALEELVKLGMLDVVHVDDVMGMGTIPWWRPVKDLSGLEDVESSDAEGEVAGEEHYIVTNPKGNEIATQEQSTAHDPGKDDNQPTLAERAMRYLEERSVPIDFDTDKSSDHRTATPTVLAEQVLHYLVVECDTFPTNISVIAESLRKPKDDVGQALVELQRMGKVYHPDVLDDSVWAISSDVYVENDPREVSHKAVVRDPPDFYDTPPSPTITTQDPPLFDLNKINLDDYFAVSPLGKRWTRIDKHLVAPTVLAAAGEEFHEDGDMLVVHRELRKGDVERWAEESVELRAQGGTTSISEEPAPVSDDTKATPELPPLDLDKIDINEFYTYDTLDGGPRTRIDKRLVDARVLLEDGEHFGDTGDQLVVQRQPGKDEIALWGRLSTELRRLEKVGPLTQEQYRQFWDGSRQHQELQQAMELSFQTRNRSEFAK